MRRVSASRIDNKWGCVNVKGEEIISIKYDGVADFSEGLAKIYLNRLYGFIDKTGEEIIPLQYSDVRYPRFVGGVAIVEMDNKYSLIDKIGNKLTDNLYDKIFDFHEDCAIAVLNKKEGAINKSGKEVIACICDSVEYFSKSF